MQTETFTLQFLDASMAEKNHLAASLVEALRDTDPGVTADRHREQADTQDFGAIVTVILGSAAVTAIAKGVANWLARNSGAKLQIQRPDGTTVIATHLDSKDAARIATAFSSK